jgi:hypothetical protein
MTFPCFIFLLWTSKLLRPTWLLNVNFNGETYAYFVKVDVLYWEIYQEKFKTTWKYIGVFVLSFRHDIWLITLAKSVTSSMPSYKPLMKQALKTSNFANRTHLCDCILHCSGKGSLSWRLCLQHKENKLHKDSQACLVSPLALIRLMTAERYVSARDCS